MMLLRLMAAAASLLAVVTTLTAAEPGYAGGGNKFDLDRWDPDYLARLKGFIADASSENADEFRPP